MANFIFHDQGQFHPLEPNGSSILRGGGRLSLSEPWTVTILQGNLTIAYFGNNGQFRSISLSELWTLPPFRTMVISIVWNHGQFHNSEPGTVPSSDQQNHNSGTQYSPLSAPWTVTVLQESMDSYIFWEQRTVQSFRATDNSIF